MPYHSLLNNNDAGDVEVFKAVSLQCPECLKSIVLRAVGWNSDDLLHGGACLARDCTPNVVDVDWHYVWGSEGFNWVEEPVGPYPTADAALDAARDKLHDNAIGYAEALRDSHQEAS